MIIIIIISSWYCNENSKLTRRVLNCWPAGVWCVIEYITQWGCTSVVNCRRSLSADVHKLIIVSLSSLAHGWSFSSRGWQRRLHWCKEAFWLLSSGSVSRSTVFTKYYIVINLYIKLFI